MPLAFEQFNFDDYELVISVTSEAAKGIITKPTTHHICICLTPTRYLWSHYDTYLQGETLQVLTKPVINYLRNWDKVAAFRPDKLIAISTEVKERIKRYYNRDSEIVFPPVTISTKKVSPTLDLPKNYFLIVSRLVPYKKVDLVIKAFNQLNLPLIIDGSGSEEKKLKALAKKNIVFVGQVGDKLLNYYYKNCKALVFPQNEDFGLTAVECQVFGKPVVAYKAGGALDTVIGGKTGVFFEEQSIKSLTKALDTFHKTKFNATLISQNAKRFSKENFKKGLLKTINI